MRLVTSATTATMSTRCEEENKGVAQETAQPCVGRVSMNERTRHTQQVRLQIKWTLVSHRARTLGNAQAALKSKLVIVTSEMQPKIFLEKS